MKGHVSFWLRLGAVGFAVAFMVLGIMAGTAQAVTNQQCFEPTPSCTFTTAPGVNPICGASGTKTTQGWFCDFGESAVGVVVGGDYYGGKLGAWDDIIQGSEFNDTIDAGQGEDIVCAAPGNDVVDGGEGDDALYGGMGNDVVSGNNGNDSIVGGQNDDVLLGGSGRRPSERWAGYDRCIGGAGVDFIFCETIAASGTSVVDGGQ